MFHRGMTFILQLNIPDEFWICKLIPLYSGQEVSVWSNCLLDLGTDFLVDNVVFVLDA